MEGPPREIVAELWKECISAVEEHLAERCPLMWPARVQGERRSKAGGHGAVVERDQIMLERSANGARAFRRSNGCVRLVAVLVALNRQQLGSRPKATVEWSRAWVESRMERQVGKYTGSYVIAPS